MSERKGCVVKNIPIFEQYNELQSKIDHCNSLISGLKKKKEKNTYFLIMSYYSTMQDNLGEYLNGKIGGRIIDLIEVERDKLELEQKKLELDCD